MRHPFNSRRLILACVLLFSLLLPAATRADDSIAGVGIKVKMADDGSFWIEDVTKGGPADRAGIKVGDKLLGIDQNSIYNYRPNEIGPAVRGAQGSTVSLTVTTGDDKPRIVPIKRAPLTPGAANPSAQNPPAQNPLDAPAQATPAPANPAQAHPAPAPTTPVLKFTRFAVKDEMCNNEEAFSVLVPEGWKREGKVDWDPNTAIEATLELKINDPNSGAQIQLLPIQQYIFIPNPMMPMQPGQNYMGSIIAEPITDLPQYVKSVFAPQILTQLQDARVTAQEDLPKVAQATEKVYGNQSKAKAGRIRYSYLVNGQPWEEDVYLTLVYTQTDALTIWCSYTAASIRAPKGTLDKLSPLLTSVLHTLRLTSDWYCDLMYVRDLFNKRMMIGIQDAAAISQTTTANAEEIHRMFADSYKTAQESEDRISQSWSETILGVNTYSNPYDSHSVELPSGYNDAWVNPKGEYILSNQGGFDPNVGSVSEWKRMNARGENGR